MAPETDPAEIEDIGSNPALRETLEEIAGRRFSRRGALLGLAAAALAHGSGQAQTAGPSSLTFSELPHRGSARGMRWRRAMRSRW